MNSQLTKQSFLAGLAVFCVSIFAAPGAISQENGNDPDTGLLEEIVVTAEKRQATLQDTAISITAVTGDMMRRMGVRDISDLISMVPNMRVADSREDFIINVRGIQSNNTTEVGDPAVAVHIDGVYRPRPRGARALFFDTARVEVLRGPQGTIYGRNATAGNVNIITNKPVNEFDASAEVSYGNYDNISATGMINVPVIDDRLMLRAAVLTNDRDGFNINNRAVKSIKNTNDADQFAARGHILARPTDDLSILVSANYQEIRGVGQSRAFINLIEDPGNERVFSLDSQNSIAIDVYGISTEINWQFGNMEMTYLGARQVDDMKNQLQDCDQTTPIGAFAIFSGDSVCEFGPFSQDSQSWSHEFRVNSTDPDARIRWLGGLYYFDEDQDAHLVFNPNPGGISLVFDQHSTGSLTKAVFGQVDLSVTEQIELVGGIRYTDDEKARYGETRTVIADFLVVGVSPNIGKTTSTSTDWKAGINWHFSDDALYYFSAGTGYKAGGFSDGVGFPYLKEDVKSYEVGAKHTLLDGRLQLNTAVFYMDYTDLQVSSVGTGPNGLPGLFTNNAAAATNWGFELEGKVALVENALLDFALSYLDAEYDEFITDDPTIPGLTAEDLAGKDLTNSPNWTLNIGAEYQIDLGGMGTLTPRVNFYFNDDMYLREFNKPIDKQDSFTKTDIVVGYRHPGGSLYVEGYVNNLENEDVRSLMQSFPGHGLQFQLAEPRTYGVRFGYEM